MESVLGCKRLDIWLKLRGVYISYSTLSRIFGLSKQITKPRERTLDELVFILGYSNFKEFAHSLKCSGSDLAIPFDMQFSFELAIEQGKLYNAACIYLEMVKQNPEAKMFSKDLAKVLYRDLSLSNKTLSLLSKSRFGRDSFFLTFIDEDDLSGNYMKSLKIHLLPNASNEDTQFVNLYETRKKVMSMQMPELKNSNDVELLNLKNVHLKSRAIEISLINLKNISGDQKEIEVDILSQQILLLFYQCSNKSEELAVLGRFARGVLYSGSAKFMAEHKDILYAMTSILNQPIVDYEFQIPIYTLLNQIKASKSLIIPQASSWPNAYYSSAVFLLTKEQRKCYERFFHTKLGVHKNFLYAYE